MKKEASRQKDSVIFEGMTSISAVINGEKRKIERVIIDRERVGKKAREIDFLKRKAAECGYTIEYSNAAELEEMTTGTSHGGIIAVCSDREIPKLSEEILTDKGFYVMIDGIEDPYNFGYALRSIYAAGADGVVLTPRNWMSAAGVVCRSSAGASELIPMFTADAAEAVDFFKAHSIKTVSAGIRNSVSAYDADLSFPVFLIVGGEKRGISAAVLEKTDMTVRLEYGREFRGSLSAASAASILSYEILRQNLKK